jgi:prepilin-type N-terminal cleavage/methylation domain-containing protein
MRSQKGFSIIELLVVISILAVITTVSLPAIRQYNSRVDLKNTSQLVRDDLRALQNKAINGEIAPENATSKTRSYWALRIDNSADNYYETAPCTTFDFAACTSSQEYKKIKLPDKFHLTHQITGKTKIVMFFSPIDGKMVAYDATPTLITNPIITLQLSSDEYNNKDFVIKINSQGNLNMEEI